MKGSCFNFLQCSILFYLITCLLSNFSLEKEKNFDLVSILKKFSNFGLKIDGKLKIVLFHVTLMSREDLIWSQNWTFL